MSYLMTTPPKFNKLVPPFLQYKNGPNLVESLQDTIQSYVENPSIFFKNCAQAIGGRFAGPKEALDIG